MNKHEPVLVTGGAGFVGYNFINELIEQGYENILVIDNLMGVPDCFFPKFSKKIKFIRGSIADANFVSSFFSKYKPTYIVHFAANANVPLSHKDPKLDFNSNILGTFNLITNSVKFNVQRFVYASSAAVYGEIKLERINENNTCNPISYYGVSKLYGEQLGFTTYRTYKLPFTSIRIFNSYGPKQPRYVMHDLYVKLKQNPSCLNVLGSGEQIRDYAYVADTVRAFRLALESDKAIGEIYNISGGVPITIKSVVELLCKTLELTPKIIYTGTSWIGDLDILTADISKIEGELGFSNEIRIEDGILKTVEWFEQNYPIDSFIYNGY